MSFAFRCLLFSFLYASGRDGVTSEWRTTDRKRQS